MSLCLCLRVCVCVSVSLSACVCVCVWTEDVENEKMYVMYFSYKENV